MKTRRLLPLTLVLLFLLAPLARAASLLSHIPSDAVALFYWNGSPELSKAYDQSHLAALLNTLNLPAFISQKIQDDLQKNAADPQKQADAKLFQELLPALVKSPTALYVGPVDFADPQHPVPRFALISHMGKTAAADFVTRINASIEKNKKPDAPPSAASVVGEDLLLTVGIPMDFEKRLAAQITENNLIDTPAFQKTVGQIGITPNTLPAAFAYVNAEAVLKLFDDAAAAKGGQAQDAWPKFKDALHLDQFHHFAWSGNFDAAGNWTGQAFIGLDDQRAGLAAFLDQKPLTEKTFKLIPKSATWAGVARLDLARFFDDIRDAAVKADPRGAQLFDMGANQFFAVTGVNFKKDLLDSLDDAYAFYTTPNPDGNSLKTFTLVTHPKDPKQLDAAFTTLETTINAMVAQRNPNSTAQFKSQPLPAPDDKITAHVLTLEKFSPAWAIHEDTLYIAASSDALQAAVDRASSPKKECILDNPHFAALFKSLTAGTPGEISAFSYIDLPHFAPEFYKFANAGLAKQAADHPDQKNPYSLPPVEKIAPTLSPSLFITWTDKDGFHAKSTGPFPFAEALNPKNLLFLMVAPRRAGAGAQMQPAPPAP